MERVRRTDYADGTDGLALKRERGRDAQNSKKIDLENYKDLKVWKYLSASSEAALGDEGDACYQRDARNYTNLFKI